MLNSEFKEKIKEYDSNTWLVQTFRSNILKDQDWAEISKVLKEEIIKYNKKSENEEYDSDQAFKRESLSINQSFNFTLNHLKLLDINNYRPHMENIKTRAVRRAKFSNEMKSTMEEFNSIRMQIFIKGDSKNIIGINEIQEKLDEQSSKIQNIYSNPVTQSDNKFKLEAKNFDLKLKNVQAVLEQIVLFQSCFNYLQPIFNGNEIHALAVEEKIFEKVNKYWTESVLDSIHNGEIVLCEFVEKDVNLLKLLVENNNVLRNIKKKLEDYLNGKRKLFPRFYFVSDEDLMRILAQSKDPNMIQSHLPKIFEGINSVFFENESVIKAMMSNDGEIVTLTKTIDVNEGNY